MEYGTYYANPHKMMGTDRSNERSASACQDRCKNMPGLLGSRTLRLGFRGFQALGFRGLGVRVYGFRV